MAGGMFAGHDQSGGELIEKDGKKYKLFYGMSSSTAMEVSLIITPNNCSLTIISRNMLVVLPITEPQKAKLFSFLIVEIWMQLFKIFWVELDQHAHMLELPS